MGYGLNWEIQGNSPTDRPTLMNRDAFEVLNVVVLLGRGKIKQSSDYSKQTFVDKKTMPDTRYGSRGRLGRGRNAKTARNSKSFVTEGRTDTARCRVACPPQKAR